MVGNGAARSAVAFPAASPPTTHAAPALSQIDDQTGRALLPDGGRYVGFTDTSGGSSSVQFTRLPFPAPPSAAKVLTAAEFAEAQGLDPPTAASLVASGLRTAHPAFSPDGRKVAWVECGPAGGGLVVLDLTSAPQVKRWSPAPEHTGCIGRAPAFSPDSRWIAYESGAGIAGLELDGAGSFSSAPPAGQGISYAQPAWSPDGSQIAVSVVSATQSWIASLSGKQYHVISNPLAHGASHPSYHLSKFPRPRVDHLAGGAVPAVESQRPGGTIDVYGTGFDVIHPDANLIWFTHPERKAPVPGRVLSARVDPDSGLGVLRVRVPELAGNGPLTVVTGSGRASTPFVVLPSPTDALQRRSVPGARIRVFGRGFDLSPATSTRVVFSSATGTPLYGTVQGGGIDGDREFLVVVVPDGVADGLIKTESNVTSRVGQGFICTTPACAFTRLYPKVSIYRDDKALPAYQQQVTAGMTLHVGVTDVPVDPFFGTGREINLTVEPSDPPKGGGQDWILQFRGTGSKLSPALTLPPSGGNTVDGAGTAVFQRSADPAWDRWGDLDVWMNDALHPARPNDVLRPLDRAYLQTPRLNIPIVLVAGTSGSPLSLNTAPPLNAVHPAEFQPYPSVCTFCFITAQAGPVIANPGPPSETQGPRVWLGPEILNPQPGIESLLALCSQIPDCHSLFSTVIASICLVSPVPCGPPPLVPTHDVTPLAGYPDLLAFSPAGTPIFPQIGPSTTDPIFRTVTVNPSLAKLAGHSLDPVYEDLISFLTERTGGGNSLVPVDSLGRRLTDAHGTPSPRPLNSGPNGLYLFPYDWRTAMPSQASALNTFISSVLNRPDVSSVDTNPARPGVQPIDKVVVITHSLGGPVARLAYLQRPDLTDQVISFGGGFAGVGKTLKILAMGDNWGIGQEGLVLDQLRDSGWGIAIQPWKVKQLAANWPTAYDQSFNSPNWFADNGAVVGGQIVDRTVIREPGSSANTWGRMTDFLRNQNKALADAAVGFWNPPGQPGGVPLDYFAEGTGPVFHYRVIGQGVRTSVGASLESGSTMACIPAAFWDPARIAIECPPRAVWWKAITADGDETVPYKTGIGRSASADDRIFVLPADTKGMVPGPTGGGSPKPADCAQVYAAVTGDAAGACKLIHRNLPNYGTSLSLINDILGGRISSEPQAETAGLPFKRQTSASTSATPENLMLSNLSKPAPAPPVRRPTVRARTDQPANPAQLELEVRGLVQLRVRNQAGQLLGVPSDPRSPMRTEIPGATYNPATFLGVGAAGNAVAYLPGDDSYDVEVTALADTTAELIARHDRSGLSLPPTDLTKGTTLSLHLEPARDLPRRITVSQPRQQQRTVFLDMLGVGGVADREPPVSVATVDNGILTVNAADEGAGVRDIWVILDGRRFIRYTGPVDVPSGTGITVYASDRAGNYEQPHGPADAPNPAETVVTVPLNRPAPTSVDIPLNADSGRGVHVAGSNRWLRATIENSDDRHPVLHVSVAPQLVPRGIHAGVVRLAYGGAQAVSSVTVAVDK